MSLYFSASASCDKMSLEVLVKCISHSGEMLQHYDFTFIHSSSASGQAYPLLHL